MDDHERGTREPRKDLLTPIRVLDVHPLGAESRKTLAGSPQCDDRARFAQGYYELSSSVRDASTLPMASGRRERRLSTSKERR